MNNSQYSSHCSVEVRPGCQRLSSQDGSVLIYVIATIVVLAALSSAMLSMYSSSIVSTSTPNRARRSLYMAESGIRYAMSELRNAPNAGARATVVTTLTSTVYSLSGGTFSFPSITGSDPIYNITAQGTSGTGATLTSRTIGPFAVNIGSSTVNDQSVTTNQDTPVDITLAGPPGSTFIIVTNPSNGTLTPTGTPGVYTYTPNPGYTGPDSFAWKVEGDPNIATVSITVNAVPVFTSDPINKPSAIRGQPYAGQTLAGEATDSDGDPLTYSKVSGPAWLNIASNGDLSGTPGAGDVGQNQWTVQVSDGNGGTDTATLRIRVFPKFFCGSSPMHKDGIENSAMSGFSKALIPFFVAALAIGVWFWRKRKSPRIQR